MKLNIKNETDRLRSVVLGQASSMGRVPTLSECYDAKSYHFVEKGIYPTEADIIHEMNELEKVLTKHGVEVFRPKIIENYNQVFARDIAFVIEDKLYVSNMIADRTNEQEAYKDVFKNIDNQNIIKLPQNVRVEGGDVLVWNDYIFVGTCAKGDFDRYKTARTNQEAVDFLQKTFPNKKIIPLQLKKNDTNPYQGVLHLDCCFNIVGKGKAILYKKGFANANDYEKIIEIFGEENCFFVDDDEMFEMFPNVFSIAPDIVVSDKFFTRLNQHLREKWNILVEEIPYREISKMGGLFRCSTLPLVRN